MSDAATRPVDSSTPDWFTDAISAPFDDGVVDVAGNPIHYMAWGDDSNPAVVLVHGILAGAHWWSHIAPFLATDHRVVALDLSGHGDSGRRSVYGVDVWAKDVVTVARTIVDDPTPVVIGHSVGARASVMAASLAPASIGGLILCDPVVGLRPGSVPMADPEAVLGFGQRRFASTAEAIRRFRPVPFQAQHLDFVKDHIAGQSVVADDGGWRWKFDPAMLASAAERHVIQLPRLETLPAPVALLRCEHGLLPEDHARLLCEEIGRDVPVIVVPDAGHHPMLDQPLALVTALRSILAVWRDRRP